MSYYYETERPKIFTEEGVEMLNAIRTTAEACIKQSGAVRFDKAVNNVSGDTWLMLACLDYLCEIGILVLVSDRATTVAQHQVYTSRRPHD